tara:strand:- start:74 stop:505 length:432 start_codon:yes stop_codon:yes gene_type:complete
MTEATLKISPETRVKKNGLLKNFIKVSNSALFIFAPIRINLKLQPFTVALIANNPLRGKNTWAIITSEATEPTYYCPRELVTDYGGLLGIGAMHFLVCWIGIFPTNIVIVKKITNCIEIALGLNIYYKVKFTVSPFITAFHRT